MGDPGEYDLTLRTTRNTLMTPRSSVRSVYASRTPGGPAMNGGGTNMIHLSSSRSSLTLARFQNFKEGASRTCGDCNRYKREAEVSICLARYH